MGGPVHLAGRTSVSSGRSGGGLHVLFNWLSPPLGLGEQVSFVLIDETVVAAASLEEVEEIAKSKDVRVVPRVRPRSCLDLGLHVGPSHCQRMASLIQAMSTAKTSELNQSNSVD